MEERKKNIIASELSRHGGQPSGGRQQMAETGALESQEVQRTRKGSRLWLALDKKRQRRIKNSYVFLNLTQKGKHQRNLIVAPRDWARGGNSGKKKIHYLVKGIVISPISLACIKIGSVLESP